MQVIELFKQHGMTEPPVRLRDELVMALEWAWYGHALSTPPQPEARGEPVAWTTQAQLDGIKGAGNNAVMWGEPLPYHPDIPLYAQPVEKQRDKGVDVERLTRPIIGIDNRSALEVFDIMADRIRAALASAQEGEG
jgi:hypothetical protein